MLRCKHHKFSTIHHTGTLTGTANVDELVRKPLSFRESAIVDESRQLPLAVSHKRAAREGRCREKAKLPLSISTAALNLGSRYAHNSWKQALTTSFNSSSRVTTIGLLPLQRIMMSQVRREHGCTTYWGFFFLWFFAIACSIMAALSILRSLRLLLCLAGFSINGGISAMRDEVEVPATEPWRCRLPSST